MAHPAQMDTQPHTWNISIVMHHKILLWTPPRSKGIYINAGLDPDLYFCLILKMLWKGKKEKKHTEIKSTAVSTGYHDQF